MSEQSAPAGSPLARARMHAHHAFDRLWKSGKMTRKQAYGWLARSMGIPKERCHMIMFNEADCAEVIRLCSLKAYEEEDKGK
jgi:zinc-finger-containing domain